MTYITKAYACVAALSAIHPHGCLGHPSTSKQGEPVQLSSSEMAHILDTIEPEYERCNSEIIDVHLHDAFWFDSAAPLLAEMDASFVSKAIMLAVYGPVASPFAPGDPNEIVEDVVKGSEGRIYGLASLNTTVPDWEQQGPAELERLSTFLAKPNFVGTKIAPPHTCLSLDSEIMRDVVHTVSISPSPLVFIHMGTTPFCGPMGLAILGTPGCCAPEYVDPSYMESLVQEYSNTTFVLVHAGADFLPPTEEYFYNGDNVAKSITMAATYDNVFLEISAFLRQDSNHTDVYSGGADILKQIADAGLANKTFYGSDVNHAPKSMAAYLSTAVEAMIAVGFSPEERCMILAENTLRVFGLEPSTPPQVPIQADSPEELKDEGAASSSPPSVSAVANAVLAAVVFASAVAN